MVQELRMDAYYYSFEKTGCIEIDRILSAVACAGKAYHHTEDWDKDVINEIQKTADSAAEIFKNTKIYCRANLLAE